jgi:hypothetical protein
VAALEREVMLAAEEPDTAGAVGVGRDGSLGFALVALPAARAPVRIEDDLRQGPVADGAVALRVSEVLRVRTFELPPERARPEPPPRVDEPQPAPVWPWLALGGVVARGASGVAPAVAGGLRVPLGEWVSLEPTGAFTLGTLRVDSAAGDVALSLRKVSLELVLAPTERPGLTGGVGAGGGIAWVTGTPTAGAGYVGTERSTQVSLLALRGFGGWQARHLRLLAFLEASALLPAITLRAGSAEVARIGQPWLLGGLLVGYAP